MAVRKLSNGKWQVDVTVGKRLDGSRDRHQPSFKTKKEAEKEERRLLLLKDQRRGKSYGRILFEEFVPDYFWPQKPNLRNSTRAGYERDINLRLMPAFGSMAMEDIGRYEIQSMISGCSSHKVATNARETLSSIMSLAVEMSVIPINPASFRYQYPPKTTDHLSEDQGEWLTTWDEIVRVLDYLAEHFPDTDVHRACVLGLCFGLRKGEMIALDDSNVFAEERYIYIEATRTAGKGGVEEYDPKTPTGGRSIPVLDIAAPWIAKWSAEGGTIIKGYRGGPMNPTTLKTHFQRIFQTGNTFDDGEPLPKLTAFSCRHSFGTACANAKVDLTKLAAWMGHADTKTTMQYYIKQKLKNLYTDADVINGIIGGLTKDGS